MKKIMLGLILAFVASPSFAWVYSNNVVVEEIIMWEGADAGNTHFRLSNGVWCYIPGSQKALQSLLLTLYASGKKAEYHCHDTADQNSGGSVPAAHKLHRVVAR